MRKKNTLVKGVMNGNISNLSFRRAIIRVKWVEWHNLLNLLTSVSLGHLRDNYYGGQQMEFTQFAPCTDF